MTIPRLHITQSLATDYTIAIVDKQAHYLLTVLRKTDGDPVLLFNGRDGEWRGVITGSRKKQVVVSLVEQTREQSASPDIWLIFAPIKAGRIDYLVEKATELGVSRLIPVQTERTIVSRINHRKLCAYAMEAAEQTERLDVPEVESSFPSLKALLNHWDTSRPLFYGDESGGGAHASDALGNQLPPLAMLIGPEGGFAPQEFQLFQSLDFMHPISLGPRILRADTAAIAALTAMQLYCGDW